MSRNEDILQAIINGESLEDYTPQSRIEALLLALGNKMESGSSSGGSGKEMEVLFQIEEIDGSNYLTLESQQQLEQVYEYINSNNVNNITCKTDVVLGDTRIVLLNMNCYVVRQINGGESITSLTINAYFSGDVKIAFGYHFGNDAANNRLSVEIIQPESLDILVLINGQTLKFYLN